MYYHGTTKKAWQDGVIGNSHLYLVDKLSQAQLYATEQTERDGGEMVVYEISLEELSKTDLVFQPDWGGFNVTDGHTWKDTLHTFGSFCVYGDINKYKSLFKEVN